MRVTGAGTCEEAKEEAQADVEEALQSHYLRDDEHRVPNLSPIEHGDPTTSQNSPPPAYFINHRAALPHGDLVKPPGVVLSVQATL